MLAQARSTWSDCGLEVGLVFQDIWHLYWAVRVPQSAIGVSLLCPQQPQQHQQGDPHQHQQPQQSAQQHQIHWPAELLFPVLLLVAWSCELFG